MPLTALPLSFNRTPPTVVVGMSGGVDSSVAACLLQQQGYPVLGLFMKNWEEDDHDGHCAAADDLRDAQAVCARLGIPLHTVNFAAEYWDRVFAYFLAEYQAGRTPNPDVLCNREIKFKVFLEHARRLGGAKIATGHYAQNAVDNQGYFLLRKGVDAGKDQSYFLYTLGQEQLAASLFPLGHLPKTEVRVLARQHGLATFAKKDSTGICFIGERRFREFLNRYLPAQPGEIVTPDGEVVGSHQGLMYYTLGQRQGLKIGGRRHSSGDAWYVADKNLENNQLIAVQGQNHPLLFSQRLLATELSWVAGQPPALPLACSAKTRYRQPDQTCVITALAEGVAHVTFAQAQWAVTPGQSVVFYQGDICLGGGIIQARLP